MPPSFPASHLLRKCAATTSLREARRLHAVLLTSTLPPTETPLFIHNNILSMYARCGSLVDAHLLLDEMPHRNIVSYNALIAAYSRRPHHAHTRFICLVNWRTRATCRMGPPSRTSLLGMYFNCGDADCAKRVFTGMKDKDAIAWNSVISGYVKNGKI
ncbi:hypothetical protein SASPL_133483 [Salvia splendens]|uniref:Pentatricopeptide repeat-containing protein n=1 Tax=Salvia splendens TaxID=180675 RepID=A0A8X8X499_SALSN|nr:hypothetical protein SASPL_133483 [Salvia splendens]